MSELSDAKTNLKNARAALATASAGGVQGYSRPGMSVTRVPIKDLIAAVQFWEAQVAQLENGFYTTADLSGRAQFMPEASVQE